jgi:hypothetical protein
MGQFPQDCDDARRITGVRRLAALVILATGFSFAISALVARPPQSTPPITRLNPLVSPDESQPLTSAPASKPWSSMGARLIYPYSIIPGDARSARELKIAIMNDPVVASHYQRFNTSKIRSLPLDLDRMAYFSYRMGDRVFWIKKRLQLAKG